MMDAVEVFRLKSGGGPFEMGGGDELLGARGQGAEKCIATPRVEFSEDVIEEEDGGPAVEGVEQAGLGEFEGVSRRRVSSGWLAARAAAKSVVALP